MSAAKQREFGTGVAVGLIAGGFVGAVLSIPNFPLSAPVGAFVAGALAAYVIYGNMGPATLAGALAGLLSLPFFIGLSEVFLIFGIIPFPTTPQPTLAQLQNTVVVIMVMDILAGAIAGSILGVVRHPPHPSTATTLLNYPPGQAKYCVQCGAQLPPGTLTCPHCGARQPEMTA